MGSDNRVVFKGACPPITHECNHVNLHLPVVQPNIACDSIDPTLNTSGPRKLGGEECHLWMGGVGANRVMRGVNILNEFNMSEGTAMISVPTACNIPHTMEVPISHLRPYVASLDGRYWSADNPADANHVDMIRCSEPTCNRPATHNDGSQEHDYMCCSGHCTCSDKYTDTHIHSNSDECEVTVGTGPLDSEISIPDDVLESFWKNKCIDDSVLDSYVDDIIENEINLSE